MGGLVQRRVAPWTVGVVSVRWAVVGCQLLALSPCEGAAVRVGWRMRLICAAAAAADPLLAVRSLNAAAVGRAAEQRDKQREKRKGEAPALAPPGQPKRTTRRKKKTATTTATTI